MPTCWVIAGPNGAGKTTFALRYLPNVVNCTRFINADLIAAGLSPLAPERELMAASRIFIQEIKDCVSANENFSFETTLAGRSYLKLITQLRSSGWKVELVYLALPKMGMSKARVAERVTHGGHNIPAKDIERRFSRSLKNLFQDFSYAVDMCTCFMNTGSQPELIFEQQGDNRDVFNTDLYSHLLQEAGLA
ncbi:AAA family ATPase [Alkalimarinus alittae]|uniref:UDP-N-acetylglucosamine kinase n=1 Tax=Alkalimarinus alittae TaxID=2961619 RepID=A0ABY6MZB0_9ALTE|nr:AAA family ATPase [Alkalimarinus alittae]UZE95168.1 hypothetical protein NKI27_13995 [Alkalimarinus alittae]